MRPIKNFEKYFMAHQYASKIFHGPYKNPRPPPLFPASPLTYLMNGPLAPSVILHVILLKKVSYAVSYITLVLNLLRKD